MKTIFALALLVALVSVSFQAEAPAQAVPAATPVVPSVNPSSPVAPHKEQVPVGDVKNQETKSKVDAKQGLAGAGFKLSSEMSLVLLPISVLIAKLF